MNRSTLALVSLLAAAALSPTIGRAQGYPVIDNMNFAEAVGIVSNTAQTVSQLTQLYNTVTSVKDAIGGSGSQQGLSPLLSMSQGLDGIAARLPLGPGGQVFPSQSQRTVAALRDFATSAFYSSTRSSASTDSSLLLSRQNAAREAALNGYAVALQARDDAANLPGRVAAAAKSAENAQDLRQDILAGNAALLLMLERLNQMQAVLAAHLEIEASTRLAADPSFVYQQAKN